MTLTEAIKSGKRFTRKGWVGYYDPTETADEAELFSARDVLADDWEVEQIKVTITRSQLIDAYRSTLNKIVLDKTKRIDHINAIAAELGL